MVLKINKKQFIISFIIFGLCLFTINYIFFINKGVICAHPDFIALIEWSWNNKSKKFAAVFGNYMPIIPYMAYSYSLFFKSYETFINNAYLLKLIIILFDVITLSLIVSLLNFKNQLKFTAVLFLLIINIPLYYNAIFWGQVDNIHSLFLLIGFYFLMKNKLEWVSCCLTIAFFTKIVSIVFFPIFILVVINKIIIKEVKLADIYKSIFAAFFTTIIIFLPMILKGSFLDYINLQTIYLESYNCISGNAYNIWYLISNKENLIYLSDKTFFFKKITFGQLGLFNFSSAYFIAILPILFIIKNNILKKQKEAIPLNTILITTILAPLLFFYFSTKIRERYAHPYLMFLTLYCLLNGKYILMFLGTFLYFLQLESVLNYTNQFNGIFSKLHQETNIYNPIFISTLFLILIVVLFKELFSSPKPYFRLNLF